jgi:hypothetical protein
MCRKKRFGVAVLELQRRANAADNWIDRSVDTWLKATDLFPQQAAETAIQPVQRRLNSD